MPKQPPPDVALLAPEWQPRALVRAQLIDEGFALAATDNWTTMRQLLRPGAKPRLAIVDLKGLENPDEVLRDLRVLMDPGRVMVLTAIGTTPQSQVAALGYRAVPRPTAVRDLVKLAIEALRRT